MEEIQKLPDAEKIMELPISYEERGKIIGRQEGKQEGKREGKKEGKQEGKQEVALQMLKKDLSFDLIVELTQLDRREIERLQKLI
ncbi:hypothetical protein J14TS2_12380 [Bacillus sp. J14TS2]|uniref:hypothetical protein n=1 Tax=Bacillus sp. J14TS2 TaxID=2807188 RepID=UPI001B01ADA2|nr:hypothetical protein [Bacillus sp. J14TS2]GIN70763.1 hypothetical protein J14TS2_12380 [Bacillus sp. J14TS2]